MPMTAPFAMMTFMRVEVVAYSRDWPVQFARVADDLRQVLDGVQVDAIEHVGSTSVPGLAAKPILDIDVIVQPEQVASATAALERAGYRHEGDLGLEGREAFASPDNTPRRHVYVCRTGTIHLRNHLAVRDILRRRKDLRDEYATVKLGLAAEPDTDIGSYLSRKSLIMQRLLEHSDLDDDERQQIWQVNY